MFTRCTSFNLLKRFEIEGFSFLTARPAFHGIMEYRRPSMMMAGTVVILILIKEDIASVVFTP
jgi:hypothetical protein